MKNLSGKVAVITGGNSGIGLGIARSLAAEGCNLLLVGMDEEKAQRAAADLAATGIKALGISCDVTKRDAVEAMADFAYDAFGTVDILVNNAGVGYGGQVFEIGEQDWDWVMDVNVKGVFQCCAVFVPRFLERGTEAHIVNMGSEQCFGLSDPQFGSMIAYNTSKHALLGFSDALRRDVAPKGMIVSLICPGPVATEIWNAERGRTAEYGDRNPVADGAGDAVAEMGMDPDLVGKITVAGMKDDDFYIITHDYIRGMIQDRYDEAYAAMDKTDRWLKEFG
ncbi:MAG: SDR family NAD(P)-dependent oxidoreductase [Alphaproteobacteria bacterium]|nr:MAG: SDR family NAD(P)-dependent oxidoreductase [Alphaproteobacteria bacterium]